MAAHERTTDIPAPPNPHRIDDAPLPESEQAAFFEAVLACARRAEATLGARVERFDVAATSVEIRFIGPAIFEAFFPALAHLHVDASEADVVLYAWDSASSGIEMPPPPVPNNSFSDRGDIWGMTSTRYRSAFHWVESSVHLLDVEHRLGVFWVPGLEKLPFWTKASPFRSFLHWWLEANGAQLIHGAAVGDDEAAVLITGRGGVGKSTTSLSAVQRGMTYLGDDYVALRVEPEPRVYSLYCTAKLDGPQMDRFPVFAELITNHGFRANEKAVVCLHPARGDQLARSRPLKAVVTPRFGSGERSRLVPVDSVALQRAATFTTLSQLPHAGERLHAFMRSLVRAVPGYALELGTERALVPDALRSLLQGEPPSIATAEPIESLPLVTVIIPVFNGAHFLADAVQSVLSQQWPALEIIVVDDGSTDDLAGALARLPTEVRLLRQENAGPAAARNRGVRDAGGEFIAFLDVDDLWPEGNLRHLVQRLRDTPSVDVVHGKAQLMKRDEGGRDIFTGDPGAAFPWYIGAGVYRKTAFSTVGLFDDQLRFGEDGDWFRRARECGIGLEHIEEICLFVRRHDGNMTRGKTQQELNALRVVKLAMDRRRAAFERIQRHVD